MTDGPHSVTAPERKFIRDLYHSQDGAFWMKRARSRRGEMEGGPSVLVFDGMASCSSDAKLTGIPADVSKRFEDIAKRDLCNAPT